MLSRSKAFAQDDLFACVDHNSWSFPILVSDEFGANMVGDIINQAVMHKDMPSWSSSLSPPPLLPSSMVLSPPRQNGKAKGKGKGKGKEKKIADTQSDRHIWIERERRSKMKTMFSQLHALIPHVSPKADKATVVVKAVNYIKDLEKILSDKEKQKEEKLKGATYLTGCNPSPITVKNKLPVQPREGYLADVVASATKSPAFTLAKPTSGFLADVVASSSKSPAVTLPNPSTGYLADVVASAIKSPVLTLEIPNATVSATAMEYPTMFKAWSSPNVQLNVSGKDAHISICCPKKAQTVLTIVSFVMEKYMLNVVTAQVSTNACARMYMIHAQANVAYEFPEALVFVEEIFKQAANEIKEWIHSF